MDSVTSKDMFKKLKYEWSTNHFGFDEFIKEHKAIGKIFIIFDGNGVVKEDSYGKAWPINHKELEAINKYYKEKENANE